MPNKDEYQPLNTSISSSSSDSDIEMSNIHSSVDITDNMSRIDDLFNSIENVSEETLDTIKKLDDVIEAIQIIRSGLSERVEAIKSEENTTHAINWSTRIVAGMWSSATAVYAALRASDKQHKVLSPDQQDIYILTLCVFIPIFPGIVLAAHYLNRHILDNKLQSSHDAFFNLNVKFQTNLMTDLAHFLREEHIGNSKAENIRQLAAEIKKDFYGVIELQENKSLYTQRIYNALGNFEKLFHEIKCYISSDKMDARPDIQEQCKTLLKNNFTKNYASFFKLKPSIQNECRVEIQEQVINNFNFS